MVYNKNKGTKRKYKLKFWNYKQYSIERTNFLQKLQKLPTVYLKN